MSKVVDFPSSENAYEQASLWVAKLDNEYPLDPDLLRQLKRWLGQSDTNKLAFEQCCATWASMDVLRELATSEAFTPAKDSKQSTLRSGLTHFGQAAVAASLVLVALVIFQVVANPPSDFPEESQRYVTQLGEQRKVILEDGSSVFLNTQSEIKVDFSKAKRRVFLTQGEAHFDVAKDYSRSFEVYVGSQLVRAVGTAFSVFRHSNSFDILVTEGKVQIAEQKTDNVAVAGRKNSVSPTTTNSFLPLATDEEILGTVDAGQGATVSPPTNNRPRPSNSEPRTTEPLTSEASSATLDARFTTVNYAENDIIRQLSWREGLLKFNGEPLSEVIDEVARYTPVTIQVNQPELLDTPVGGQFKIGKIEELLEILETGFELEVTKVNNNHYLVSSKNN